MGGNVGKIIKLKKDETKWWNKRRWKKIKENKTK